MQLIVPQVLDGRGVGCAPEKLGELAHDAAPTALKNKCEFFNDDLIELALYAPSTRARVL